MMHHQEYVPPEALRERIKCFWYNRSDLGAQETSFEVQPDGYAEIIFHFGEGCSIAYDGGWQPLPSPFIMGLLNQPAVFKAKSRFEIIAIRCFPWTVFDLLGLASGKDGVRVFEHAIGRLQTSLGECVDAGRIEDAIAIVTQYFINTETQAAVNQTLHKAGAAMSGANGTLPVSQVAAAAHATVRTLERQFKQSSGYTVKDVSGLMRFEEVRNRLWHEPNVKLAGLAAELGYTDQAHLSREFKRYSGSTPAAFARKAKKQGLSNDFVAIVQA